ncbi:MAG: hypothetical protein IT162_16850 [Bryobacterales bacterium]|nr:hypothetical protein [Bryobacterales bacterium]
MRLTRRALLAGAVVSANPVLRTGVPAATKDKPQSKLWRANGSWWALLPGARGPALWRREPRGWQRQDYLDSYFHGLPGQADVLANDGVAAAVLVEAGRLVVVRLRWDASRRHYEAGGAPVVIDDQKGIETATIAGVGTRLWIAYNSERHMWARSSEEWARPMRVTLSAAKDDDICQAVAFAGEVGVIWSDQAADAVFLRRHNGETWLAPETADRGGNTADDHISTAVAKDGTLFVATKNSVDTLGQPQLVLRIRSPRGQWRTLPYAPLTATQGPTRPITLLSADQKTLHLLHTVAQRGVKPASSSIVLLSTPAAAPTLTAEPRVLIAGAGQINNVTGPKTGAGLVLASDEGGNIYEAMPGLR